MGARRLGLGVVVVALWLVAAACGGGGGAAGNAGAVSGTNATAGGGGPATGGPGPSKVWGPVAEVPSEKRFAALHDVSDRWAELSKLPDLAGRRKQLADYIAAQPEFEESGVAKSSIWGRFKDQRIVIIVDAPSLAGTPRTPPAPAQPPHARVRPEAPRETLAFGIPERSGMTMQLGNHGQVPAGEQALIFDYFTSQSASAPATDAQLQHMLAASGYQVFQRDMTAQSLKANVNTNVGVLYINTHGGQGSIRQDPNLRNPDGTVMTAQAVFGLMTTEAVPGTGGGPLTASGHTQNTWRTATDAPDISSADLASGAVVYMQHEPAEAYYYAVTNLFFRDQQLGQHALVWLNVCDSMMLEGGSADPDPRRHFSAIPLVSRLMQMGADLVVGWTAAVIPAKGWGSALLGFDLLLGANAYPYGVPGVAPVTGFPQGLPASTHARPFQWSTVAAALVASGLDQSVDPSSTPPTLASLTVVGTTTKVLTPGITYIDVMQTDPDTIQIHGEFGDDPGSSNRDVYLSQDATPPPAPSTSHPPNESSFGTKIAPACTWQPTKITCQLQGDLADKAGWVRVVARKHPSNPVPITMWTPTMTWKNSVTTQEVELKPIFRADLHRYRENAIDPPKYRTAAFAIAPSYASSSCHINGLMQVMKNGKGIQAVLDTTYDNGSATKDIVLQPEIPPPGWPMRMAPTTKVGSCNAGGWFDPNTGTWTFDFGALFRAATTMDNSSPNPRHSPGASAQDVAQARQTVQGLAGAGGLGPSTPVAPANGPSPPRDAPTQNWHDPLMLDLTQFDGDNKGFMGTGPPPLKIDPARPEDRERLGKANFKIDDWQRLLTNRPNTTLTISAGGFDGKYAPDNNTAR